MKNQIRYCWLDPNLTFSSSWSEAQHDRLFTQKDLDAAAKKGWRIVKYQIVVGQDFEFPNQSHLALTSGGNIKLKK